IVAQGTELVTPVGRAGNGASGAPLNRIALQPPEEQPNIRDVVLASSIVNMPNVHAVSKAVKGGIDQFKLVCVPQVYSGRAGYAHMVQILRGHEKLKELYNVRRP